MSSFASSTWGHQGAGLSEQQASHVEADAFVCSGIEPSGRCGVMASMVTDGIHGSPRATIVREAIRAWFEMLRTAPSTEIKDILAAWPKA